MSNVFQKKNRPWAFAITLILIFSSMAMARSRPPKRTRDQLLKVLEVHTNQNLVATCTNLDHSVHQEAASASAGVTCENLTLPASGRLYVIPPFLFNFKFDENNWMKSEPLDRAIVGAYRLSQSSKKGRALEQLEDEISEDLGVDVESVKSALPLMSRAPLSAAEVRSLTAHLRFQASDIFLRLDGMLILSTALDVYKNDPALFTAQEWKELFNNINGAVARATPTETQANGLKSVRLAQIELLTVPAEYRSSESKVSDVSDYLKQNQRFFYQHFEDVFRLRSQVAPDLQEEIVARTCSSIRKYFERDVYFDKVTHDPFADEHAAELANFVSTHADAAERATFLITVTKAAMSPDRYRVSGSYDNVIHSLINDNIALIRDNTELSNELFQILVTDAKPEQDIAFDFIEKLFDVWQEQGLLNNANSRDKLVQNFDAVIKMWNLTYMVPRWKTVDWLTRAMQYSKLTNGHKEGVLLGLVTEKFVKTATEDGVNVVVEKSITEIFDWLLVSAGDGMSTTRAHFARDDARSRERLIQIAIGYASSSAEAQNSYPHFEKHLIETLHSLLANHPDELVRFIKSLALVRPAKNQSMALFLYKIKDLFSQDVNVQSDFDKLYLGQLENMVATIFGTQASRSKDKLAIAKEGIEHQLLLAYRDYRARSDAKSRHATLQLAMDDALFFRVDSGLLFETLRDELKRFNGRTPPPLTLISCNQLLTARNATPSAEKPKTDLLK